MKRLLLALGVVAALAAPAAAAPIVKNFPPLTGGGGGGAVSSVSGGSGCATVSPTTGAPVVTSTGCLSADFSNVTSPSGARTALGLGTLATQNGTFSGTSSGTNTGDQTITLTGNVTGSGTGSFATTIANGVVTLGMHANLAANSFMGNNTASPTAPLALTVSQAWGLLSTVPAAQFPALTGDVTTTAGSLATTISGLALSKLATQATQTVLGNGSGSTVVPVALAITSATGLIADATTLKNTFAIGLSGGQTVIGDTLTTGNLTLRSNGADLTSGKTIFGTTSLMYFDTSVTQLAIGNSSPPSGYIMALNKSANNSTASLYISNPSAGGVATSSVSVGQSATNPIAGGLMAMYMLGSGFTTSGPYIAGSGILELFGGSGNMGFSILQASGDHVFMSTSSKTERFRIANGGTATFMNSPFVSFTSASTRIAQSAGTVMEFGATPPSQVSATSSKLDAYKWDAVTATFTGGTAITTATGVNFLDVEAPTLTSASATTIAVASTLSLGGPPTAGGSVTITSPYTLNVRSGNAFFGGSIAITNTLATPGSGVIVTTDAPTGVVSLSLKYINMQVNGVATYVLALQ